MFSFSLFSIGNAHLFMYSQGTPASVAFFSPSGVKFCLDVVRRLSGEQLTQIKVQLPRSHAEQTWIMHASEVWKRSPALLTVALFSVCRHRAYHAGCNDSRRPLCERHCGKANSWTPGCSDSQRSAMTTHRPPLSDLPSPSSLFVQRCK